MQHDYAKIGRGRSYERAITLVECIIYIGVLALIMSLAYNAFYRYLDYSRSLRRNAEDIIRALKAGERWRADVRAASGPVRVEMENHAQALRIPQTNDEVIYLFTAAGDIWRLTQNAPLGQPLLENVKASNMMADPRSRLTVWRWEVELISRKRDLRLRPLFTFEAVPKPTL